MTNSNKSVFIDRNTSNIKHGWQEKWMIMEYNACVSCALIGHNVPTVLQCPIIIFMLMLYRIYNVRLKSAHWQRGSGRVIKYYSACRTKVQHAAPKFNVPFNLFGYHEP